MRDRDPLAETDRPPWVHDHVGFQSVTHLPMLVLEQGAEHSRNARRMALTA